MTKNNALIAVALAGLMSSGFAAAADATAGGAKMEKCFGVAKAGQNDCASKAGGHSCAGQSKKDLSPNDWKNVPAGTCASMGGKVEEMKPAAK
ncbi:DUF2282 domain-containing protein [Solimicrobium silvestre]|uniref:Putative integral membrane protein n=1 Tax=Solimicrobium silvestre TaxID=2099400 RepID=A0A2S9H5J8_9BURK|nr:DUF2282 domain-containing protein [Solimicrobium silvestre]PRC95228.1 putative integral membrane protein [Solimicrobium silvestre]